MTSSTLSTVVHARLLADLLAGDPAPGDPLPSERTLSGRFGVNRHAVREAIKRLQQAGLVHVSQGGATRVLDWREHAGLGLLPALAEADPESSELTRAALEMRLCIGVDAARLCAGRASATTLADLVAIVERPRGQGAGAADEDHADAYADLWRAIVIGADNVAYRLSFNSLVAGGSGERLRGLSLGEARDVEAQRDLVGAIEAGDADRAGAIAAELLGRTLALAPAGGDHPGARATEGSPAGV
jgi:GntR family transcriptional repressor for pyruvate dehydrogenase complex